MRFALISMVALTITPAAFAGGLDIHQGRAQAGGTATFILANYGNGTGMNAGLLIAPEVGYFLTHEVELLLGANIGIDAPIDTLGVSAGARYLSPTEPLVLYGGGQLGFADMDYGFGVSDTAVALTGMGGMLIPVSPDLALDVGARLNLYISTNSDNVAWSLPVGYLGVQGFFDLPNNKGRGTSRDPRQTPLE